MNEEELLKKIVLLEANVEYYKGIAEKHFQTPKEKYALANLENGDLTSARELQKEINALRSLHAQLKKRNDEELMILEEESNLINIKNTKHERRFLKLYYVSLREKTKELDPLTLGLLQKLITHLRTDGSNGLIGSALKKDWYDITDIPKRTFDRHFKLLEDHNIVKFKRNQGIFINPYYARYGNQIEPETLELFELIYDKNNGLKQTQQIEPEE
jgi:DNA-binding transcriptional ArsR family regulator